MPTPTGLPKAGEVWERTYRIHGKIPTKTRIQKIRFIVLERGSGSYWALRVAYVKEGFWKKELWVDPSYAKQQGELVYIGPASEKIKRKLGLG